MKDDFVTGIIQLSSDKLELSQMVYTDLTYGSEIVPWAKPATDTNDTLTSSQPIYLVDTILASPTYSAELNVIQRIDQLTTTNPPHSPYHSTHIHGLVGAKKNNSTIRGINPGQPIRTFGYSLQSSGAVNSASFSDALGTAAAWAESLGEFSALNISNNTLGDYDMNSLGAAGIYNKVIRSLSNRFLVTQSAGNNNYDACWYAYHFFEHYRENDGIIVVGGTTQGGDRFTSGTEAIPGASAPVKGSNFGACVEAWAPGHLLTSLDPTGGTRVSTGTSYSAPIVAAIATRYGNTQTRPIEREAYIVNNLYNTGFSTGGYPIRTVKYTNPASNSIPKRLPIANLWSPTTLTNLNTVKDERFYDLGSGYWNAGGNWGSISLDLGSIKTVTGVRLTLRSSAGVNGSKVEFAVSSGNTDFHNPSTNVTYYGEDAHVDLAPVYINLGATNARYLKIDGNNYGSWLAYSEIEVYGY